MKYIGFYWTLFAPMIKKSIANRFGKELAEDLTLFIQQSHTPGVIGMILKTAHSGTIITTSDTLYSAESYRRELPPGGTINKTTDEFYENLVRIRAMEKEYDATLLFGHDYDQVVAWAEKGWID